MKRHPIWSCNPLFVWIVLSLAGMVTHSFGQYRFTTLDDPLGTEGTFPRSIDGNNVVGYYQDSLGKYHGFLLSGTTYTAIDDPSGTGGSSADGISGKNIVGNYVDTGGTNHGFLLSGTTYTTISTPFPGPDTYVSGISGKNIVGAYKDSNGITHGFLLTGTTFTTFDDPLAVKQNSYVSNGTIPTGISGKDIVGYFINHTGSTVHGFLLSGTTFTTLDEPFGSESTYPSGISGKNIVGVFQAPAQHGFFYNGSTFINMDDPLGEISGVNYAQGISGNTIVGYYYDTNGNPHGYLVTPSEVKYTALLSGTSKSASIPKGTGYATMSVSAKGGIVMAGKLPDGESFSTFGTLVGSKTENQIVISKDLIYPSVTNKGASGFLLGTLTFDAVSGTSDFNGSIEWIKPEQSTGEYQAAIDTNLNVIGSIYIPPAKGDSVLPGFPVEGGTTSGMLELSDTSGVIASGSCQLTAGNKLTITNPPDDLKAVITPANGVIKGTFDYPGHNTPTEFSGVLYQDQIKGGGFFLGPNGGGTMSLTGT